MPKLLATRIHDAGDTARRFEQAAGQRFREAALLRENGMGLAAIYLFGYCIEMWLKAAAYTALGHSQRQQISREDRAAAEDLVRAYAASANVGHNLPAWADFIALAKTSISQRDAETLRDKTDRFYQLWRETLRYAPNRATRREVEEAYDIAVWFKKHYARVLR